ncbi:TrmB family transcriptional regulator [Haloarcula halophila]|uniref:TrmB family transcriptional regulator n=1 Tax=Haloarcula TaxID=2237 RepID=UPI0023E38F29|nr:TrmB family transcriptional regulator sugar-binding domain-containing protein [Halomicroarcula sp. DFY41]
MTDGTQELRNELAEFGLSDKEIDTYLSILEFGEAKASDIAEQAGVSKRYVYNVLSSFEKRGFVTINDHETPTTVRAVAPSEVISRLSTRLDSMESKLQEHYNPKVAPNREFEVIKSRSTVHSRIVDMLNTAEEEVTLSIPASVLPNVREELSNALSEGLFILVQVNADERADISRSTLEGIGTVVRYWEESGPMLMTVDRQEGLFSPNEFLGGNQTDNQAISFTEERLAPILVGSFLGNYWPVAEEVYVDDPFEPPHRYERFRHAIFDATIHERRGRSLVAELSVRPTGSQEDFETRYGEIVEVRQGLIKPMNSSFAIEHTFVIKDNNETFTVGGKGAFMEDYEAEYVMLDIVGEDTESISEMMAHSTRLNGTKNGETG